MSNLLKKKFNFSNIGNKSASSFDFDNYYSSILNFVIELEKNFTISDILKFENMENYSKEMQEILLKYFEQKYNMNPFKEEFNSVLNKKIKPISDDTKDKYSTLMIKLNKLIKKCRKGEIINLTRLYEKLAECGISAVGSIPIALFSFMIAIDPHCSNEVNQKLNSSDAFKEYHPIERVIFYAISFGGESNKIASMAGSVIDFF